MPRCSWVSSAALLAITYGLVDHATSGCGFGSQDGSASVVCYRDGQPNTHPSSTAVVGRQGAITVGGLTPEQQQAPSAQQAESNNWHAAEMRALLVQSGIALAIMAAGSIGLGWVIAGRALRPVRTITATARRISATSLNERLALNGPDDEFKELGDTLDGLLARMEASFRAQRQFVANASHELRTPLARQQLASQLALADPDASIESLRMAHERVLASGAQQEQLIEALLTPASGQAGLDRHEPFDPPASRTDGGQPHRQRAALQRAGRLDRGRHRHPGRTRRPRRDQHRTGNTRGGNRAATAPVPAAGRRSDRARQGARPRPVHRAGHR